MEKNFDIYFCMLLEKEIHLTNERKDHIHFQHREMKRLFKELVETINRPNLILKKPGGELLLVKWHPGIFNGKYIVVVVKNDPTRMWILTAYMSSRIPNGEFYEY